MNHPSLRQTRLFVALAISMLFALPGSGQVPGGGASPAGMNSAIVKLFGSNNFTAAATVTVKDSAGTQILLTPMDFTLLDGKVRVQIDLSQMKSKEMSPAAANSLMQMGLSRVVSVIRPDKQTGYVIYPDRKAYANMPFSKEDVQAAARTPKIQKTVLGKETVDGHPCVKTKVVITADNAAPVEAVTWNATDLKEFPIQVQTTERGNTSFVLFRQIKFTRADPKLFEVPAGFAAFSNPQELMQTVARDLQKAQGTATPKKK
jgi:hypothetical protein